MLGIVGGMGFSFSFFLPPFFVKDLRVRVWLCFELSSSLDWYEIRMHDAEGLRSWSNLSFIFRIDSGIG